MKAQAGTPKCERKEELVEYLYDEMPLARRELFADHLTGCVSCSADLQGMERLRGDLRAWDVNTVPHMELVIPRSKLEVLKELLTLFPVWSRALLATGTAAAALLIALGTVSLFNQPNDPPAAQANNNVTSEPEKAQVATSAQNTAPVLPSAEVKALVNAEVAKALEQERQTLRAQLAALDGRNQEQRIQLQTALRQLRDLNVRQQEILAAQQPSIRSIFSDFEPSTER